LLVDISRNSLYNAPYNRRMADTNYIINPLSFFASLNPLCFSYSFAI